MLEKTFSSSRKQKSQLQWVCVGLFCFDFLQRGCLKPH